MKYTINESQLREIIAESVNYVLNEGILDNMKQGWWNFRHISRMYPPFSSHIPTLPQEDNVRAHNPYTYNKRNFYPESPGYKSKESTDITMDDDGWIVNRVHSDVYYLKQCLGDGSELPEFRENCIHKDIELAEEYGLTKYAQHLRKMYFQYLQQHKNKN